jgi:hypothetical protein
MNVILYLYSHMNFKFKIYNVTFKSNFKNISFNFVYISIKRTLTREEKNRKGVMKKKKIHFLFAQTEWRKLFN